jgi:hypothetical protein
MAAARLGWKPWDQLLTREIARFAHCDQSEVKQPEKSAGTRVKIQKNIRIVIPAKQKGVLTVAQQECRNRSSRRLADRIGHKYQHEMRGFSAAACLKIVASETQRNPDAFRNVGKCRIRRGRTLAFVHERLRP